MDSVRNALVSLINSKITPLFAVRDFNITPSMVKTKFEISTEEIEFPTFEARYYLSSDSDNQDIKPSAIMSRNGLGQFVEIVERAAVDVYGQENCGFIGCWRYCWSFTMFLYAIMALSLREPQHPDIYAVLLLPFYCSTALNKALKSRCIFIKISV